MSLAAGQLLVREPEKGSQTGQPVGVGDALGDVLPKETMIDGTAANDELMLVLEPIGEDFGLVDDDFDVPNVKEMRDDEMTGLHCP